MRQVNKQLFLKTIPGHVAGWILFIGFDAGYAWYAGGFTGSLPDTLYFYACNISLFYIHFRILSKTITPRHRAYYLAALLIATELVLYTVIKGLYEWFVFPLPGPFTTNLALFKRFILNDIVRNIYYAGIATLAWASGNVARYQRERAEAEINRLLLARDNEILAATLARVENAYLRHQIQPHLMLNALNFIYSSVYKYSAEGAEVVLMLADIMRFTLNAAGQDGKVGLAEEIAQVRNLVAINRLRFGLDHELILDLPSGTVPFRIIPLVLITLTENMFKHGDFRDPGAYLKLHVSKGGLLTFETNNAKKQGSGLSASRAIGMANTRLRLEHSYGQAYTLITESDESCFHLILTIDLCK